MKIGLVGYQGGGKSTVFELLTGVKPDVAKTHTGQLGVAVVPDDRFNQLVALYQPKKITPAKIELFDTPGLSLDRQDANAQRLGVIREGTALVHVIGAFNGSHPLDIAERFVDDLKLADLQVVTNRIERLKKDITKPRPDRESLQAELDAITPVAAELEAGNTLHEYEFSDAQEKAVRSFSLLTRKRLFIVINTSDADYDATAVAKLEEQGYRVVAAPVGLELEVQALPEEEQAEFAAEMGLGDPCRDRLLAAIFDVTDQITFYTCDEKEVHAWLLERGSSALDAAGSIHTDLARGFIRAEVMPTADLLRLGSEREAKAANCHHVEGKEYVVQDGDEIVIRFSV